MAEHDDERDVASRRYRALPQEEPPAALDDAIRAQARRAVEARPAPLVAPTGRRQWYFPVAAAAILVLAVAVTWQIEREQPDMVAVAPAPQPAPPAQPRVLMQERAADAAKPAERRAPQAPERRRDEAAELAKQQGAESKREAASAAAPAVRAQTFSETPEQWLERIARLRAEGKHDEADKALEEFRKRYPDFRIPPEMLEKVEKK